MNKTMQTYRNSNIFKNFVKINNISNASAYTCTITLLNMLPTGYHFKVTCSRNFCAIKDYFFVLPLFYRLD